VNGAWGQMLLLKLLSAFKGAGQGIVIGVFQFGTEGESASKSGNPDAKRQEYLIQIQGGLLSLEVGIGSQDNLMHGTVLQSVGKLFYPDVAGADTLNW